MRILSGVSAALLAVVTGMAGPIGLITDNVNFQSQNHSMWGPGPSATLDTETLILITDWDSTVSAGHIYKDPLFGTKWGAKASAGTSGELGLGYHASLSSGAVNVAYPVAVDLMFPTVAKPGEMITIQTGFDFLPGAELVTYSARGSADFSAEFSLDVSVGAKACIGGCVSGSAEVLDVSLDIPLGINKDFPTIDTVGSVHDIHLPFPLSGDFRILSSTGQGEAGDAGVNLTPLLELFFPLSYSINVADIAGFEIDFLEVETGVSLEARQDFTFLGEPYVDLRLSTGERLTGPAGTSFQVKFPEYGSLGVTPLYNLQNMFWNTTSLNADSYLALWILQAGVDVFGIDALSLGPAVTLSYPMGELGSFTLFENAWRMQGFKGYPGTQFVIEAVPEPASLLLVGAGLIVLAMGRGWRKGR